MTPDQDSIDASGVPRIIFLDTGITVSLQIKALFAIKGKKHVELANYLDITPQSMQNKLARGSFSAEDLIKISTFLDCTLAFEVNYSQKIILDEQDLRTKE